ncbi:exodeoxyribonuclease III [Desulfuromonas versatilis]|uniref:Exodeoxyribonuclease III n=1 Tax=Desulfuromonas versatilis TaxID=2802975 RepID=A0ABM8HQ77_9BACT|nr:exodeoxyribonuclease III [Desulfuromonas versatilis]BCR04249.1 exodeoxyribonuclease III [Desulfuromonas versatilis]
MKLVSFNVNGLRSRLHQLEAVVTKHRPDIIGLQETKVQDVDFPVAAIEALGYRVAFHGQKTHYGVALLSRQEPIEVQLGFPGDGEDAQRRLIRGWFRLADGSTLQVINGYFPQGENREHPVKFPGKQRFYADLQACLEQGCDPATPLVVMGDFNIAPVDHDIGIGEDNARRWLRTGKTSFLPEERGWFQALQSWGLHDSFRELNPGIDDRFSWFDYRSRGFESDPRRGLRIDHILLTAGLMESCREAGIDYEIRAMEKPSDHCPVWADLELG